MQHRTTRSYGGLAAVLIVVACQIISAQSVSPAGTPASNAIASRPRVPIGYDPAPDGLGLRIRAPKIDGPGFTTQVTNGGSKPIVAITYVAIVERVPHAVAVTVLTSPEWTMTLATGQTTEIQDSWLNAETLDQVIAAAPSQAQIFLAPSRIRYADGTQWQRPAINATATDHRVALGFQAPDVTRALIAAAAEAAAASPTSALCRDDHGAGFSTGAILPVRNEPGKQARCQSGRWADVSR